MYLLPSVKLLADAFLYLFHFISFLHTSLSSQESHTIQTGFYSIVWGLAPSKQVHTLMIASLVL